MKKIILMALLTLALNAEGLYMTLAYGTVHSENKEKFLEEPVHNVVGGKSQRLDLEVGKAFYMPSGYETFVLVYGWQYDKEKNDELGFGVGMKQRFHPIIHYKIRFEWGARAGLGSQYNKGEHFTTKTNSSALHTANGDTREVAREATFREDTSVFEIGLKCGLSYKVSKKVSLSLTYEHLMRYYNVEYSIKGELMGMTLSGVNQSGHAVQSAVTYKF